MRFGFKRKWHGIVRCSEKKEVFFAIYRYI